jgi:mono/diheme cytochrome c family protein
MLPVIIFSAFWVVLAFGIFFVAVRGGPGGARAALQTQSRGARRMFVATFAVIYIAFGIAIPLLFLAGDRHNASAKVGGLRLTAAEKRGRELFGQNCAVCHTLAAANAVGKVGPNLDQLMPPALLVLNTINNGCLQSPPPGSNEGCLGYGTMPSQVVQGKQAQDVADFVSKVAGKE